MRKAASLLHKDDENMGKFLFVRRHEVKELDSDGKVRSQRSTTVRREPYEELVVTRVIARNDQPLSDDEKQKQEERIKTNVEAYRKRQSAGPSTPAQKKQKQESDEEMMIREFPEALDFKSAGSETRNGRVLDVYEIAPRPGYVARNYKMRFFEKVKGKCWVDRASSELVEADAVVFDAVSVGFGLLGKVSKGTEFHLERMEAAPGLWVSHVTRAKFDARVLLVKSFRQEVDTRFTELRLRKTERAAR